jgi:hypothetical protein
MDPLTAARPQPDPEAVEFIRFCYQRRRVGWPELYDEMCAVAARGLFRGYGSDDLAGFGIGFTLFEMPSLAAMSAQVIAEVQARRRPVQVTIRAEVPGVAGGVADVATEVLLEVPIAPLAIVVPIRPEAVPVMADRSAPALVRLALAPTRA